MDSDKDQNNEDSNVLVKPKKRNKFVKVVSQPTAIKNFFDKTCSNGLTFKQNESVENIIEKCQNKGHFFFKKEDSTTWYFVKSKYKNQKCIRMLFFFCDSEGTKIHNIEKIIKLMGDVEKVLIFIDHNEIYKKNSYTILETIKVLRS